MGGAASAIEAGYTQTEIQKSAYRFQQEIERNERIVVGMNKFQVKEEEPKGLLKIDEDVQREQIEFLNKVRAQRNEQEVKVKLTALKTAAESNANLMPVILDAVKVYASIGEICNTMRGVFGEYKEHVVI